MLERSASERGAHAHEREQGKKEKKDKKDKKEKKQKDEKPKAKGRVSWLDTAPQDEAGEEARKSRRSEGQSDGSPLQAGPDAASQDAMSAQDEDDWSAIDPGHRPRKAAGRGADGAGPAQSASRGSIFGEEPVGNASHGSILETSGGGSHGSILDASGAVGRLARMGYEGTATRGSIFDDDSGSRGSIFDRPHDGVSRSHGSILDDGVSRSHGSILDAPDRSSRRSKHRGSSQGAGRSRRGGGDLAAIVEASSGVEGGAASPESWDRDAEHSGRSHGSILDAPEMRTSRRSRGAGRRGGDLQSIVEAPASEGAVASSSLSGLGPRGGAIDERGAGGMARLESERLPSGGDGGLGHGRSRGSLFEEDAGEDPEAPADGPGPFGAAFDGASASLRGIFGGEGRSSRNGARGRRSGHPQERGGSDSEGSLGEVLAGSPPRRRPQNGRGEGDALKAGPATSAWLGALSRSGGRSGSDSEDSIDDSSRHSRAPLAI